MVITNKQINKYFIIINFHNNKGMRPRTRQPWTYGAMSADPVSRKVSERPSTALWQVEENKKKKEIAKLELTGDPVLGTRALTLTYTVISNAICYCYILC